MKIDITDDTAARGAMIGEITERVPLDRTAKARPALQLLKQHFINTDTVNRSSGSSNTVPLEQ